MTVNKGIILAAGMGTRLSDSYVEPKPLVKVLGQPIIFHTLQSFIKAGIRDLGVVIGFQGDKVRQIVEDNWTAQTNEDVCITWIENPRWTEPNGLSLYAARHFTGSDDFILSMVDHLFDVKIIKLLSAATLTGGAMLAVDEKIDQIFDLDDATKVLLDDDNHILKINKGLTKYNAIDCGVFRCRPPVYATLEQAFSEGNFSISAGMQILAQAKQFAALPIGQLYWQDIDTPEMLKEAERRFDVTSVFEPKVPSLLSQR